MSNVPRKEVSLDAQIRVMQIIKFALIMGITAFAAVALLNRPQGARQNQSIWQVLAVMGGILILARLVVPSLIVRSGLRQIAAGTWRIPNPRVPLPTTDEGRLALLYQNQMLVGSALLEGGAFGNLFSCMTTGHIVSWIMSGILWLGLLIDFPTRLSVERWIESKLARIRDERSLLGRP